MSVLARVRAVSSPGVARKNALVSAIVLSAVALTAAACSGTATAATSAGRSGESATASTTASQASALTAAQARQVFGSYVSQTDRAVAAGDKKAALSLTRGVAWHQMTYAFLGAHIAPYQYGKPAFILPAQSAYPQWFAVSVRRTAPPGTPTSLAGVPQPASGQVLMVFEKPAQHKPWQLSDSVQLQPGQQVPALATTAGGDAETAVASDSASYLARPDVVGPLQAAVVDDGPSAPATSAVASGPLTTGIYASEAAIKPVPGDIRQWMLEGTNYGQFAVRTADGGALVFYDMYLNAVTEVPAELSLASTVPPGKPIAIPPPFIPLAPGHQTPARVKLNTQYDLSFAAIDPPASRQNAKIQVIAMGGSPNWVSGH